MSDKQQVLYKLENYYKEVMSIEKTYKLEVYELKEKLNIAIKNLKENHFSIAFFGAFSDGKSSLLSALTKKLDIKISPDPTTDKVEAYRFGDYEIIDTPGLFSENLKHDEITKKYISEANIIIYVVNPVNPLKEAQTDEIKWILSDLKKLDSTIFVINKMDSIADLEDEEDFQENSIVKKEVVSETLNSIINKKEEYKIVAVSADPFGDGLEFWLDQENIFEYQQFSRIGTLENIISNFEQNYKKELISKAGLSVIEDTKKRVLRELNILQKGLEQQSTQLRTQVKEHRNELSILKRDISEAHRNIIDELIALREDILIEIDSTNDFEQLGNVLNRKLGEDGYILNTKIEDIVSRYTTPVIEQNYQFVLSIEETLLHYSKEQELLNDTLKGAGKGFIKVISNSSTRTIADAILKIRDFLNIGFKFKPWGVIKFAKFMKFLPAVISILEVVGKVYSEWKFASKKAEVKQELGKAFKKLINVEMTLSKYTANYFDSTLIEIEKIFSEIEEESTSVEKNLLDLSKVIYQLNSDII